ncbi:Cyclin-dependent kinase 20 [Camelus dromedarius]|uniref:Cyclin-dependent kinase 20 n=1 Tax=Camelus dromedarius TaxID=9838 RepID=A0A5N4D6X7_CAMDR|nr:Cyclin-dependent kinase 20 [Camelus dromedarius]
MGQDLLQSCRFPSAQGDLPPRPTQPPDVHDFHVDRPLEEALVNPELIHPFIPEGRDAGPGPACVPPTLDNSGLLFLCSSLIQPQRAYSMPGPVPSQAMRSGMKFEGPRDWRCVRRATPDQENVSQRREVYTFQHSLCFY